VARRGPVFTAVAVSAALAWCTGANAHIVPDPQVLPSGTVTIMRLAVPNERPEPMNAFEATVPAGFRIVDARPVDGWTVQADEFTARWRGGPLAHLAIETFVLEVEVNADPGMPILDTRQLYPSGAQVTWPADVRSFPAPQRRPVSCRRGCGC
jgi:hypothetical protein